MYQKLIENIIYPLSDKLMGLSINKNLKNNRNSQWYNVQELRFLQQKKRLRPAQSENHIF